MIVNGDRAVGISFGGVGGNGVVTMDFKQSIGATDPLRTRTYAKTLTFTLSTTNP